MFEGVFLNSKAIAGSLEKNNKYSRAEILCICFLEINPETK